ncbi:hypothetical protein [Streptomonospora arabica]|uniref:Uncharacterized protein n=1 Tax=Streptomonospora arabica TaxID=412417 RepID=A0ABV9SRF5_9ACTN
MSDTVGALAERIAGFTFVEDPRKQRSQIALFEEYLRRSALWFRAVPGAAWPFGDLAAALAPSVRADDALVRRVDEALPLDQSKEVVDSCLNALHFEALKASAAQLPDLPAPYEPLLLMYERGNGVHTTQIYFQIGASGVRKGPPEDFASTAPLPSLDSTTLDAIDARAS